MLDRRGARHDAPFSSCDDRRGWAGRPPELEVIGEPTLRVSAASGTSSTSIRSARIRPGGGKGGV